MDSEIDQYDKFIQYAVNVEVIEFKNNFYDGKFDSYVKNNIMLMRKNFGEFWCGLDNKSKQKYIDLVKMYYDTDL